MLAAMRNAGTANLTYSAGALTLGIWTSTSNGSQPLQQLASYQHHGGPGPRKRLANSSGLHSSLAGGDYYWLVVSTSSDSTFVLARLTSPYQSSVKVSDDGGKTWILPAEGPSEYSSSIILSRETRGLASRTSPRSSSPRPASWAAHPSDPSYSGQGGLPRGL